MKKMVKPDFLKAFNFEKSILEWCGVYPVHNPKLKFKNARLFFCFFINFGQLALMIMLLVVNDIENFLEASHFIIISITLLFKLSMFVLGNKAMKNVENHLNSIIVSDIPRQILDHVIKEEKTRNILYFPQRFMVLGGLAFQLLACLILHNLRLVILISWSPFDLQDPKYYYPTLFFQTICFIMSGMPNTGMDITYYVLVDIACCELDILMYNLTNLDTSKTPSEIEKDVRKCAINHQEIIRSNVKKLVTEKQLLKKWLKSTREPTNIIGTNSKNNVKETTV